MSRPLSVFLPVGITPERVVAALADDPPGWLPPPARPAGPDMYRVVLRGLGRERTVVLTVGQPWRRSDGCWRPVRWTPSPDPADVLPVDRLLPSFQGEIGAVRSSDGGASLVLNGSYDVPGSRLGEVLDAAGLAVVARGTAERFLGEVAARIGGGRQPGSGALHRTTAP